MPPSSFDPMKKPNSFGVHPSMDFKTMKQTPKTVAQAVERLASEMSLKDKTTLANMAEVELSTLHATLGSYIRNTYGLWAGNNELMASCRFASNDLSIDENAASSLIIRELWKQLRKTYKLRVVKK
jgi:hypothetical protein